MHIYHTTDYFQNWTVYEHIVPPNGIREQFGTYAPDRVSLHVFPNPSNATYNISYELSTMQDVELKIFDLLGRQVWANDIGAQSPGNHCISVNNDQLPSGQYYLLLQSQQEQITKTITIIK